MMKAPMGPPGRDGRSGIDGDGRPAGRPSSCQRIVIRSGLDQPWTYQFSTSQSLVAVLGLFLKPPNRLLMPSGSKR